MPVRIWSLGFCCSKWLPEPISSKWGGGASSRWYHPPNTSACLIYAGILNRQSSRAKVAGSYKYNRGMSQRSPKLSLSSWRQNIEAAVISLTGTSICGQWAMGNGSCKDFGGVPLHFWLDAFQPIRLSEITGLIGPIWTNQDRIKTGLFVAD